MVKLSDLKVGNVYYILDNYDLEPCITEIIVREKGNRFRIVENIRHIANNMSLEDDFMFSEYNNYEECRYEKITSSDIHNIYENCEDENLITRLDNLIEIHIAEIEDLRIEEYIPPHEYPDWDGDESIMYYLDNYVEDDEDYDNGH